MAKFESALELAQKIAWEGGASAALEYGIGINDLAELSDVPAEVVGAFAMLAVAQQFFDTIDEWVAETLERELTDNV